MLCSPLSLIPLTYPCNYFYIPNPIFLSLSAELVEYGALDVMAREYGAWFDPSKTETGYDVSLHIDIESLPEDKGE